MERVKKINFRLSHSEHYMFMVLVKGVLGTIAKHMRVTDILSF